MSDRKCARRADREIAGARPKFLIRRAWRLALVPFLVWLGLQPAHADDRYSIDQQVGSIGFSVNYLGLFTSQGQFRRFDAQLVLDGAHPERSRITAHADAASAALPWQDATAMMRSPDFFDAQQYPEIQFQSTSVQQEGPDRYAVTGRVELRGVWQPLVLDVRLVGRHPDPARHADVADFVATGTVQRSAFGMIADENFISDRVKITINVRIALDAQFNGD
jgi:polyisoprenoid-binding protein YceI